MNNEIPELPKENKPQDEVIIQETKEKIENVVKESNKVLKKETKSFVQFFKDVKEYLSTKKTSEIGEMLFRELLIVAILIVIYYPFMIFKDLIPNLLIAININYDSVNKFYAIIDIIYSILVIVLFFVITRDRFYKMVKNQEEIKNSKK